MLKIPALQDVIRMASLVDSTRTLAILVGCGVSILENLNIVMRRRTTLCTKSHSKSLQKS